MYETKHQPLLRRALFLRRLVAHAVAALVLVAGSVAIGMAGYMRFEDLAALDAFIEAAVLLAGLGPMHLPATNAGKLFAGFFALYAGLVFVAITALILGPVIHRVLHRFHLDKD